MATMATNASTVLLKLTGNIPSKKNSKIMVCFGKSPRLLPSKNYKDWHTEASKQIALQTPQFAPQHDFPLKSTQSITITLYAPTKRLYDLTNKAESVNDLLVDCGILEDDNYQVIPELILKFGGVDKIGGADILITK